MSQVKIAKKKQVIMDLLKKKNSSIKGEAASAALPPMGEKLFFLGRVTVEAEIREEMRTFPAFCFLTESGEPITCSFKRLILTNIKYLKFGQIIPEDALRECEVMVRPYSEDGTILDKEEKTSMMLKEGKKELRPEQIAEFDFAKPEEIEKALAAV